MTDTTAKTTPRARKRAKVPNPDLGHRTDAVDALAAPAGPTLRMVDPALLVADLATNVRDDLRLDQAFLDSVAELGVLQPVVCCPDPVFDGKYRVVLGNRRAAAAQHAGLASVPAIIAASTQDADRVAAQLAENTQRAAMTGAEQARAINSLHLFGWPADLIAKKTSRPRADVDAAIQVADTLGPDRLDMVEPISLVDAAAILEFADDPEVYDQLVADIADDPAYTEHLIQRKRDERDRRARKLEREAELHAEGIRTLAETSEADDRAGWVDHLDILVVDDGGTAMIPSKSQIYDTLMPDHPDQIAVAVSTWGGEKWFVHQDAIAARDGWSIGRNVRQTKTDEQKAQDKLDRARKQLWTAATTVRRTHIKQLLSRRQPPTGWVIVVGRHLAGLAGPINHYKAAELVDEWLGITGDNTSPYVHVDGDYLHYSRTARWVDRHPSRLDRYALAAACAGMEVRLDHFETESKPWRILEPIAGPYLEWLAQTGYTLTQLEQDVVDRDWERRQALMSAGKDSDA